MANCFDWFTGVATIGEPCPPSLAEPEGMSRFFATPNHAEFGARVPRILMHESLHSFQLMGSRWLQGMVAEEWERLLTFERTGTAPPVGAQRRQYGRAEAGMPMSIRDLVECLARFWDMHIRGPDRVIEEEGFPDPQGRLAQLRERRKARGGIPYDDVEYDAAMRAGAGQDTYARPYLWLLRTALGSPAVRHLGRRDPGRNAKRATWAVNMLLPIAGFFALNAAEPVRAFIAGVEAVLGDEHGLELPTAAENRWALVELDLLAVWAPLSERLARVLKVRGLTPTASLTGPMEREGWGGHPLWRRMPQRMTAWREALTLGVLSELAPDPLRPWLDLEQRLLRDLLSRHAFAALGLMGIPPLRAALGAALAPPLLRFRDRQISSPAPAGTGDLAQCAETAEARHRVLRNADLAAKLGIGAVSFQ